MEYDMLKPARAENSPTGSSQRLGALSAAESGARLLPPGEGQAAADNGSIRSVVAAEGDAFDAGQARAALYRREAGVHDHDSDDSGSDVDMDEEPQPCGLSLATCSLMGGRALSQAFNLCANGQQPTGPQASAAGEEDGNEEGEKAENAILVDVGGEEGDGCSPAGGQHDGVEDVLSEQVKTGSTSPSPPPSLLQGRGAVPPALPSTVAAATAQPPPYRPSSSTTPGSTQTPLGRPSGGTPAATSPPVPSAAPSAAAPPRPYRPTASTTPGSAPHQGPSSGNEHPASRTRDTSASVGEGVRTEKPMFHLWPLAKLKEEATREAGPRNALKYGPLLEDELRQISNAKREDLVHALTARMEWAASLDQDPEWIKIPPGITPERKKAQHVNRVAAATRKARGSAPKGGSSQSHCCRLVCLTVHPDFNGDYICFRGGGEGVARTEQDVRALGERHRFFVKVAKAMATPNWRDSHGNPLSVPDDHSKDDRASEHLKSLLKNLDLESSATSLREELRTVFKGDEDAFYADLQSRCFEWLGNVRSHHTKFKVNETKSGGAGADATYDGGFGDTRHPFQFMQGRLATMLWEDGIDALGGDDDETHRPGDSVLPDGHPGSGSSVPGGPGVRGKGEVKPARSSGNTNSRKPKKRKAESEDRAELVAGTKELLAVLRKAAEREARGDEPAFGHLQQARAKDLAMEQFIGDVQRLQEKVDSAESDLLREGYQELLGAAKARVAQARAEKKRDEAAVAASSAAAASPPYPSPTAPSTPAAVEGGAGSGHALPELAVFPEGTSVEQLPAVALALARTEGGAGLD